MKSIFLPCWKGSSVIRQSPFGNAKKALSWCERAFFMFRNSVFQFFVLCIMLIYSGLYGSLIKRLYAAISVFLSITRILVELALLFFTPAHAVFSQFRTGFHSCRPGRKIMPPVGSQLYVNAQTDDAVGACERVAYFHRCACLHLVIVSVERLEPCGVYLHLVRHVHPDTQSVRP